MLRNDVQKITGLTRKAIEYYEEKNLINPTRDNNGYRKYSSKDLERLRIIKIYRRMNLSIEEISQLLNADGDLCLASIIRNKNISLQLAIKRQNILEKYLENKDLDYLEEETKKLENERTIYEKLIEIFPGYYGQLLFMNYKPFLNHKLSEEEKVSFDKYVEYIDSLPSLDLSDDERAFIEASSQTISLEDMEDIASKKIDSIYSYEDWYHENLNIIEEYEKLKASDIYKKSPINTINEKLVKFMEENSYYEIAIPLIRKFSPSYDKYYRKLLEANNYYINQISDQKS